jgi:hypothetical protein
MGMILTGEPLTDILVNILLVMLIIVFAIPAVLIVGLLWFIVIGTIHDILVWLFA